MLRHRWMSVTLAMLGLAAVASTASASDEDVMLQAKAASEALVKAFNEHQAKAVGSLFTETADYAFLEGSSLETLQFGLVSGRDRIIGTVETFFQTFPSAKLTHTVVGPGSSLPMSWCRTRTWRSRGCPGLRTDQGPGRGRPRAGRRGLEDRRGRNISKVPPQKP